MNYNLVVKIKLYKNKVLLLFSVIESETNNSTFSSNDFCGRQALHIPDKKYVARVVQFIDDVCN